MCLSLASTKSAALDFGLRYFAENKSTGQGGRGLKYTVLVQLLSSTTTPGETRLRPRVMEARLERVANGELLELWAERQAAVQKAGAQPAAAAPAAPEPAAIEDGGEVRPGCSDRVYQDLVEEAMGDDAESDKVLRAVHKKVVDQQLGPAMKLLGAAKSAHRHEAGVVETCVCV